jgi:glycosyltransferase involved in cell wall biosynthesis
MMSIALTTLAASQARRLTSQMMITVHIVSNVFPPQPGGLQLWTEALATVLSEAGFRPIVYICAHPAVADLHGDAPFEIVDVAPLADVWTAPLRDLWMGSQALARDRSRVAFACLKAEIAKRSSPEPQIVLSNFITTAGFTAHLVAQELSLAHVAVVVGTDYTRGLRNPEERYLFQDVCASAHLVVAKSEEQRRGIARLVPNARLEVIDTSVDVPEERWRRSPATPIRIFSDCGFSFKKGTGVLIDACRALAGEGIGVHLEICGGDQPRESTYWAERRGEASQVPGLSTSFPGHLAPGDLIGRMLDADIYASATLGEGSSEGRARALCAGIPMVTTRCGELFEDPGADHLRLAPVADAAAFRAELSGLARKMIEGDWTIDDNVVAAYRARFDRQAEWTRWIDLLRREAIRG